MQSIFCSTILQIHKRTHLQENIIVNLYIATDIGYKIGKKHENLNRENIYKYSAIKTLDYSIFNFWQFGH